jgi:hypothetical protein
VYCQDQTAASLGFSAELVAFLAYNFFTYQMLHEKNAQARESFEKCELAFYAANKRSKRSQLLAKADTSSSFQSGGNNPTHVMHKDTGWIMLWRKEVLLTE